MQLNEQTYHGKRDINYIFFEGAESCPFLLVAFQAVPNVKKSNEENAEKPKKFYNYIKSLSKINVNRLFIEDCGDFGCYYLCNNMNFDIEDSVFSLIESTRKKLKVKKQNVIVFGSSKGGTAALYYGAKYGYGHIISGAPQTKIAAYLTKVRPSMLQYIVGDSMEPQNIEYIDGIVLNSIHEGLKSKINILTSPYDNQYSAHIEPLIERFSQQNVKANVVINEKIKKHGDIAIYFPAFLVDNIIRIIDNYFGVCNLEFSHFPNMFRIKDRKRKKFDISTYIRLVGINNKLITKSRVTDEGFEYKSDGIFPYTAVYSVRNNGEMIYSRELCSSVFTNNEFEYNGYTLEFDNEEKVLRFRLDIKFKTTPVFYMAMNLGKKQVYPTFRTEKPYFDFPIEEPGLYFVKFIIRIKNIGQLKDRTSYYPISFE